MTALRIDSEAAALRRRVGPVAWFVLEELLLGDGHSEGGAFVSVASTRSLASALSLNKDTVARALLSLARAGVVTSLRQSNDGGRFGVGGYRVQPWPGLLRIDGTPSEIPRERSRPRKSSRRPRPERAQLSLLDLGATPDVDQPNTTSGTTPKSVDALAPEVGRSAGSGSC